MRNMERIKKRKKKPSRQPVRGLCGLAAAVLVLSGCVAAVPAFADSGPAEDHNEYSDYYDEVTNKGKTGDIDIDIEEMQTDPATGEEVPYEHEKTVLPGQDISKIVRVENKAEPAYIRLSVSYVSDGSLEWLSDEALQLDETAAAKWKKIGDYWYYTEPVPAGEKVPFMNGFTVPGSLTNEFAGEEFNVNITVDAVQSTHFDPDFDSDDPWFGTVIEQCEHSDGYDPGEEGDEVFSVEFEGGAEGLVRVGEDFFSNWTRLMPGDSLTDEVEIRDAYGPVAIYFRTETLEEDPLLSSLEIEIKNDDVVIYKGTMFGALKDPVLLGDYQKGESSKLTYTVTVPSWLPNSFSMSATQTKWIFTAKLPVDLPNTGGIGTAVFFAVGFSLASVGVGIAHWYFCRQRRNNHAS